MIEHFVGAPAGECFTNAVCDIEVAAGASVEHYRIQQESTRGFHIGHVNVRLQQDSRYAARTTSHWAPVSRALNLSTTLQGPGAHVALDGLLAPLGTQHLDAHTTIDHAAPHTTSDENYRGIAGERGRGVFNGKVIVRPGAQKTDARQSSRNLLLTAGAEIDTKPELEIYADDVKCSHGATTGQLDAAALFYLRSRGLDEAAARTLLIRAFAESIVTSIAAVGGPQSHRAAARRTLQDDLMSAAIVPARPRSVDFDVAAHPPRLSDPRSAGQRQAARVSRQRRLEPAPARGDRSHRPLLRARPRQRSSRRAHAEPARHRRL